MSLMTHVLDIDYNDVIIIDRDNDNLPVGLYIFDNHVGWHMLSHWLIMLVTPPACSIFYFKLKIGILKIQ